MIRGVMKGRNAVTKGDDRDGGGTCAVHEGLCSGKGKGDTTTGWQCEEQVEFMMDRMVTIIG